jgi:hypothetical protein
LPALTQERRTLYLQPWLLRLLLLLLAVVVNRDNCPRKLVPCGYFLVHDVDGPHDATILQQKQI